MREITCGKEDRIQCVRVEVVVLEWSKQNPEPQKVLVRVSVGNRYFFFLALEKRGKKKGGKEDRKNLSSWPFSLRSSLPSVHFLPTTILLLKQESKKRYTRVLSYSSQTQVYIHQ